MANESIRQRTHKNVDRIIDKAEDIRDGSEEKFAHLKQKAIDTRENIDGYIERNPEKSVLIAAGVGIVIGAIFTAAMMREEEIKFY